MKTSLPRTLLFKHHLLKMWFFVCFQILKERCRVATQCHREIEENKKQKIGQEHDLALYLRHLYMGSPRMTRNVFMFRTNKHHFVMISFKGLLMRSWNDKVVLERANVAL